MDLDKLMEYLIVTDQVDEFLGIKKEEDEEESEKSEEEDNKKRR